MIFQSVYDNWVITTNDKGWLLFQKDKEPQFLDMEETCEFLFNHPCYSKLEMTIKQYLEIVAWSLRKPDPSLFREESDISCINEDRVMKVGPVFIRRLGPHYEIACFHLGMKARVSDPKNFIDGTRYIGRLGPEYFEPLILGTPKLLKNLLNNWDGPYYREDVMPHKNFKA